jgi:hypothetical protein
MIEIILIFIQGWQALAVLRFKLRLPCYNFKNNVRFFGEAKMILICSKIHKLGLHSFMKSNQQLCENFTPTFFLF